MTDPGTGDAARARLRQSLAATSADYTFSHVFPPLTAQAEFFTKTTLPLVRDLLVQGRNGLLFAYGVTNSGKTYTVQGGAQEGSAGILPRTLDVIFNSIEGMQSDGNVSVDIPELVCTPAKRECNSSFGPSVSMALSQTIGPPRRMPPLPRCARNPHSRLCSTNFPRTAMLRPHLAQMSTPLSFLSTGTMSTRSGSHMLRSTMRRSTIYSHPPPVVAAVATWAAGRRASRGQPQQAPRSCSVGER